VCVRARTMSKRRAFLDGDNDECETNICGVKIPLHHYMPSKVTMVFLIWFALFCANGFYNLHRGEFDGRKKIEDAKALHRSCVNDPVVMQNFFKSCRNASIEQHMSVEDLRMDYFLEHTNVCIRVGCMKLVTDLIEKTGWLFIGIGMIGVLLFYVSLRYWPVHDFHNEYNSSLVRQLTPYYPPPQEEQKKERLKEIKSN